MTKGRIQTAARPLARRAAALVMAVVLSLCFVLSAAADKELAAQQSNRFNVMLVIDGSGSLVSKSNGTDKDGLRYDAIELFMALLTNQGNNVGAVVFDDDSQQYILNTGISSVSGKDEKMSIAKQIRDAGTGGDTDIGSALLTAVEQLEAQQQTDDNRSAIILFSDGRTDLGGDEKAYEQSLANKDEAITRAQAAQIPIYGICLAASPVADPAEVEEIADRTSGSSVTINNADELSAAFEQFYKMIFNTSSTQAENEVFPEDGVLNLKTTVPAYGAEEINVILNGKNAEDLSVSAKAPSKSYSSADLDKNTITAGEYKVVKIVAPEKGEWDFTIQGTPGSSVILNVLYNVDTTAVLSTADGADSYGEGSAAPLKLEMYKDGTAVQDVSVTSDYKATLTVTDLSSGKTVETLPMQADGSAFTCDVSGLDGGSYSFVGQLVHDGVQIQSNTVNISWNNTPPDFANADKNKIKDGVKIVKKIVTPITGRKYKEDLTNLFADDQDGQLSYQIVSSQLVSDTAKLDGSVLTVNTARSRSGDLVVRAVDSQGAYKDLTIRFKVTNLTLIIFLAILGGILIAAIAAFLGWRAARPLFKGELNVSNATPGSATLTRASFRGKIRLNMFQVGACGFDAKKCCFASCPGGRVEFRAPGTFYVNQIAYKKSYSLLPGQTIIYADEQQTQGIRVYIKNYY